MRRSHAVLGLFAAAGLSACFGSGSSSGTKGNADFSYSSCLLGCRLDSAALAAVGARETIDVHIHTGAGLLAQVSSSHPEVATFVRGSNGSEVLATSGQAGATDLILLDAAGKEIDRAQVSVRNTDQLVLDQGWGTAMGPTVLSGSAHNLHTTTKAGGQTLVGTGAVAFTLDGTLQPGGGIMFGDSVNFTGTPGGGNIAADCTDAHVVVPVTVVAPAELTSVDLSAPTLTFDHTVTGQIDVTVHAGAQPVFGAPCTWTSAPAGLLTPSTVAGGTLGTSAKTTFQFSGSAGSYTATCTVPGGLSAALAVKIN